MAARKDAQGSNPLNYRKGVLLIVLSSVAVSGSGVYSRLLTTDLFTTLAVRSFFGGIALLMLSFFFEGGWSRRQWRLVFRPAGFAMIACHIVSQISFVGALSLTSVANVAVIYATAPFVAALLSWVFLRIRAPIRTIFAGCLSFSGVAVIVGFSFRSDAGLGSLLALLMTVSFTIIIISRGSAQVPQFFCRQ